MTILLSVPPLIEKQIEESIAQRDAQRLQQLLMEAVPLTVERLLNPPLPKLTKEEFQQFINDFTASIDTKLEGRAILLSDYAVSREGIYEDHA